MCWLLCGGLHVHVHSPSLCPGFEALQKAFQKAKSVVEKEGATPIFYVRTLVELEDYVQGVSVSYNEHTFHYTHACDCEVALGH